MPIEVGIWRLDEQCKRLDFTPFSNETRLEDILSTDIAVINPDLLVIGRQVVTAFGKYIDLLAIDIDGNLVVIELKRDKTPREVVAQLLDYGSWVRNLEDEDIAKTFDDYIKKYYPEKSGISLDQAFCDKFDVTGMPELNQDHELVIVASELDDSTERIINYLAEEYGVAINAVFFRFFKDDDRQYLTRAWMIDPSEAEAKVVEKREKLPWNGEYYVSFDKDYDWEEARKYGFVCAGGGSWYSRSLSMLEKDARIWVNISGGVGYVGVGRVIEERVPIDDYLIDDGHGKKVPITTLPLNSAKLRTKAKDPEKAEYFVRVEWIKTVPADKAIREKGLFGNQNSAAKPRAKKWTYTIDRLKQRFNISE